MSKILLVALIALSFGMTSIFAESTIEVNVNSENIKALDTVLVTGKITGVSEYKPVKLTVKGPDGSIVYAPLLAIGDNGEFKKLLQPTIPSFKAGTYTVTASHEDTEVTAQTQFTVTSQELPRNQVNQSVQESIIEKEKEIAASGIILTADAVNGSDIITLVGKTSYRSTDITLIVKSPTGKIVSIAQVTPGVQGDFEVELKTGGPLWKEDGMYTITANQGAASEYKKSVNVEIQDGVVVPEFGVIAALVLAISIFVTILFSTKSKLSILQKY